ncbi:uncharacterized protein O3C94_002451 [Discoglossus pictus]
MLSPSAGDTVNMSCLRPPDSDRIRQITWTKQNTSHSLHFAFLKNGSNGTYINFTDPRFSFLSSELPLVLEIRDAQPSDSGNYSCNITGRGGVNATTWELRVSEQKPPTSEGRRGWELSVGLVGFALLLIILISVICYKKHHRTSVHQNFVHQSSQETNQGVQVIYEEPQDCYFQSFNTLYEGLPSESVR